jgi:hypothetical protein
MVRHASESRMYCEFIETEITQVQANHNQLEDVQRMKTQPESQVNVVSAELVSTAHPDQMPRNPVARRRSFIKKSLVAGAVAVGAGMLAKVPSALGESSTASLTQGDIAILQFLAAAEIIESDLWLQYQELGGVQDDEVAKLASKLIPGTPLRQLGGIHSI